MKAFLTPAALTIAVAICPVQTAAQDSDFLPGGKLVLTNATSSIEGSSGGGIATWATIGGLETDRGFGVTGHATIIELPDYGWQSHGIAIGIANRVELSYARQNFDTRNVGAALGLGRGYTLNQDVFGAKLRVAGDLVYGDPLMPQISIGVQHKRNLDGAVTRAVGAASANGTDFVVSASKLLLSRSMLLSATARYTAANQTGLLGFGSGTRHDYAIEFEGSAAYQLSRRAVLGAEFRSKPDRLGLGEDDWMDLFAAYAVTDNLTLTAAYADLGSIATFEDQRGAFLSAQLAF
ncbi:DUF3034 family protein [Altererythrobacter confluentis]|uniref:DUF3034 family protein n=1 Tax=Allopontixanthobacter confluentis TaxID=1849021 RepID=A0A6L7GJE4_9SPHN|nr:DUF3034 family protein [Allopontixanthobacter confluentis]MXP15640.1 DUF3034 family protein [Allopontixanthobacter confluentis]